MLSNPKLTSQELYIYKNYILQEISEAFTKYGYVKPKDLEPLLDVNAEVSEITELIYATIKFNIDAYTSYKSLDKFNLIDKPNNLFDNYELITVSVPVKRLVTPERTYQVTPYSSKDTLKLINDKIMKKQYPFFITEKHEEIILTNGDKETIDFVGQEYSLIIDYMKQNETELIQYRNKINELLLEIFKKIKPISNKKLIGLLNKYYNDED